jgi:deazaflavin-dependent oxidoreductase (nitroreductase family)
MNMSTAAEDRLLKIFKFFNRFMLLLWRLGLGTWVNGTEFGGSIMVIKHTGRKTGLTRQTPLNYAFIDGDIFCTAGLGGRSDWYQNILANPQVEVWLPNERWQGIAEDASETEDRTLSLRKVLKASGFAGPLFGVNPKKLTDADLEQLLTSYRLVRIRRAEAVTGPGGPGDLAWVWPVSTFVLFGFLLISRKKRP